MAGSQYVRIAETPLQRRAMRTPAHPFYVRTIPWAIQPMLIAPVLPGESLKNLMVQSRVITDPIKNPLAGWWKEYYFFYVKLTDLGVAGDAAVNMLIGNDPSGALADLQTYSNAGTAVPNQFYWADATPPGVNWVKLCLDRVVATYFRDEGEDETTHLVTDTHTGTAVAVVDTVHPLAQFNMNDVWDSLRIDDTVEATDVTVAGGADTTVTVREIDAAFRQWELLKQSNLMPLSYEDYLATYGIRMSREKAHEPELIRYSRNWTYPSNTVEPTTGSPTSACSWSIAERADKVRLFKEPGFIFGVTVTRPKIYRSKQVGSATSLLNDAMSWLPAVLLDNPETSRKEVSSDEGPFGTHPTTDFYFDVKDLFMHGEQFVNVDMAQDTVASAYVPALPTPDAALLNPRYPAALADIQGLFVNSATGNYYVREDGICTLTIASPLRDTSPRGGPDITL